MKLKNLKHFSIAKSLSSQIDEIQNFQELEYFKVNKRQLTIEYCRLSPLTKWFHIFEKVPDNIASFNMRDKNWNKKCLWKLVFSWAWFSKSFEYHHNLKAFWRIILSSMGSGGYRIFAARNECPKYHPRSV